VLEKVKNMDIPSAFVSHLFGEKNLAVFFNALRRAVNNLDNTAANRKLQWLVGTLRSFPAKEKTIVFSNFLDAGLRLVAAKLPSTISYAVIEGKVPMDERKKIVDDFNKGKYRVLFISKAGGEGLDMKGVRHVILMDPTWNEASNEQVIGRAIRFRSHADLPTAERNVTVHRLLHVFPEDVPVMKEVDDYFTKKGKEEPLLSPEDNSIDLFLTYFLRKKQAELDKYNAMLQSYSIEKNACP
jgi:superfamily II DNA/RNA helicase